MFSKDEIQRLVEQNIPGSETQVRDMTGGGDHFELIVVANAFEGKGLVDRHRMVYGAIGKAVGGEIHALALKTFTPKEAGRNE